MKIERSNNQEPTPEDLQELERLKRVIEAAIADGKLSTDEINQIRAQAKADGKVTVEEVQLYRQLITEKIASGELEYEQ